MNIGQDYDGGDFRVHGVRCCGVLSDADCITEKEYLRAFATKADNYPSQHLDGRNEHCTRHPTTKHNEHENIRRHRRVRFCEPDGGDGRLHDDNGRPRLVRHGDESYAWSDYSHDNCQKILEELMHAKAKVAMRAVQHGKGEDQNYATYGMFTHGGVHGITKATKEDDALVRYLNHFGREHLGSDATWTSISVTKDVEIEVHRDSNNLRGTTNFCVTFGQKSGGNLWLEEDVTETQAHGKGIVWKKDHGNWTPGRYHNTTRTFVAFDPFKKHCSGPWEGSRWCLTYHTVRGITEVGNEIKKFLRRAGFPVPGFKSRGGESTSTRTPRKSTRNGIMNTAGKIGVLMTTLLAAAGSYMSEVCPTSVEYDPIVMMELGGVEGTGEAVDLGKTVIEPFMWSDLLNNNTQENAYHFVTRALPRELRVHVNEMPARLENFTKDLITEQINGGGEVVLRGRRGLDFLTHFSDFLKYKSAADEDVWVILGKTKSGTRSAGDGQRQHEVCVVGTGDETDERPPRYDGSGITFDAEVPKLIQSSLRRLHQNLGHPRNEDLCRHLKLAGCEPQVTKAVKGMRCETCEATKHAQIARPTTLPRLLDFNSCVGVDIFYCHDAMDTRHAFLAIVDWATTYQVAVKLEAETGQDIEQAFNNYWLGVFGPPVTVSLDLDGKVQAG